MLPRYAACIAKDTLNLTDETSAIEQRLNFLLGLEEALRAARSPQAVTQVAAELLGKHLLAGRAGYGDIVRDGQAVRVERDWSADMSSLAGEARVLDGFGPERASPR